MIKHVLLLSHPFPPMPEYYNIHLTCLLMVLSSFLRVNAFPFSKLLNTSLVGNRAAVQGKTQMQMKMQQRGLASNTNFAEGLFKSRHPAAYATRSLNHQSKSRRFSSSKILGSLSGGEQNSSKKPKTAVFMSSAAAAATAATVLLNNTDETSCENSTNFPEEALKQDTYGGMTIKLNELTKEGEDFDADSFARTLENSLRRWKAEGKRGIWIHIPTTCSDVVPLCTKLGFEFQHAKNGLLVMTHWLPENSHSRLPNGPTHQIGVGAIILHPDTHKMLVVQEKTGPAAGMKLWKMPTGLTDPGEDIVEAAIREAKEETGLDVEFDRIICIRQAHGGILNQSDMFFVCLLRLSPAYKEGLEKGVEVQLVPQEEEIADIKWMTMEDYAAQDLWQGSPLYQELNSSMMHVAYSAMRENDSESNGATDGSKANEGEQCGLIAKTLPLGWRPGLQTIYLSKL